jgi:hypothetical protein
MSERESQYKTALMNGTVGMFFTFLYLFLEVALEKFTSTRLRFELCKMKCCSIGIPWAQCFEFRNNNCKTGNARNLQVKG